MVSFSDLLDLANAISPSLDPWETLDAVTDLRAMAQESPAACKGQLNDHALDRLDQVYKRELGEQFNLRASL